MEEEDTLFSLPNVFLCKSVMNKSAVALVETFDIDQKLIHQSNKYQQTCEIVPFKMIDIYLIQENPLSFFNDLSSIKGQLMDTT